MESLFLQKETTYIQPQKLDFGCGQAKTSGFIGLDTYSTPGVDVVHDFNVFPYPFSDNTFDEIICKSSLEHVDDFIKTVTELHRISKPDALITVYCPHFSGPDAYRDPTHKTFFSYCTFDIFTNGGSYKSAYNGMFHVQTCEFGVPWEKGIFKSIIKGLFNRFPNFYESHMCWIFPAKTIFYKLRVIKSK
jgi:SAM-dependent methyltransferase